MYVFALPRESRSNEICVEINIKPEKNIHDIIDRNSSKRLADFFIIFGINIFDTTGYEISVIISTSLNVCYCTTWGNQTKHNMC